MSNSQELTDNEAKEARAASRRLRLANASRKHTQSGTAGSLRAGLDLREAPPDIPPLPPRLGSDAGSVEGSDEDRGRVGTPSSGSSRKRKSWQADLPDVTALPAEETTMNFGSQRGGWAASQSLRETATIEPCMKGLNADGDLAQGSTGTGDSDSWEYRNVQMRDDMSACDAQKGNPNTRVSLSTTQSTPKLEVDSPAPPPRSSILAPPQRHGEKKDTGGSVKDARTSTRLDLRRSKTGAIVMKAPEGEGRSYFWFFQDLLERQWFEPFFAILILLNTCVMAAEMQYFGMERGFRMKYPGMDDTATAANVWPAAEGVFYWAEWIFGGLFAVELVIKFLGLRMNFFQDPWNWLDIIIVAFWCIGVMGNSVLPLDPTLLRLVRLVRLMRLLRLVKTLQGFESLYLMTTSIKASILALMWSTVLLFLLQMSLAVILNQLLMGFITDEGQDRGKRHRVYQYFGTFSKATLTMFEFMLANWPPSSRVLTEDVSEFYLFFVLSYQCIIAFAVVKVIMGVFLQVTFNVAATDDIIMLNQKERSVRTHTKKMEKLFMAADQDGNGVMDKEEFRNMVDDPVVRQWLSSMDCDVSLFAKDPDVLFSLVDDGDEELTAEELVKGVARMQGPARSIDLALLNDENKQVSEIVHDLTCEVDMMKEKDLWGNIKKTKSSGVRCSLVSAGAMDDTSDLIVDDNQGSDEDSESEESEEDSEEEDGEVEEEDLGIAPELQVTRQDSMAVKPSRSMSKRSLRSRRKTVGAAMFRTGMSKTFSEEIEDRNSIPCWVEEWVRGPRFEGLFGFFILLNTLALAVEVQYAGIDAGNFIEYPDCPWPAKKAWPWAEDMFFAIDWFFLVIFTVEVALKVSVIKTLFFKDLWNWFDLLIVTCGIIEATFEGLMPLDPSLLRLARMIRLLRMLRVVRTIQGFDSLYLMTTSIIGSLQALMWFSVLMFVVQMLIALLLNTLLESYLLDPLVSKGQRHLLFSYFGTFSKAILTMFEITLANWIPVCRALTENVSEWYVIFALVHKFIIGFAVVMVITGVFLQETFKVAATDDTIMINQKQRQIKTHTKKMSLLFQAADEDGNGVLDRDEFKAMVEDPNVVTWLSSMGLDINDADDLFTMVNRESEGDDEITAADLVRGVARLKGHAKSIDLAVVLHHNTQLLEEVKMLQTKVTKLKDIRKKQLEDFKLRKQDRNATVS